MKKYYLLFILFITTLTANAQDFHNEDIKGLINNEIDSIISAKLKQQKDFKNIETNVILLDSMISHLGLDSAEPCVVVRKYYYTYDSFGRMSELLFKIRQEQGCEPYERKTTFTYDGLNLIERKSDLYDFDLNIWINESKIELSYNDNNLKVEEKRFSWDIISNEWFWYRHYETNYDDNNNIIIYLVYRWDEDINDWETSYKEVSIYDINENIIEFERYSKYENEQQYEWTEIKKNIYTYDNDNFLLEHLYYSSWNNITMTWDYNSKYSYVNNGSGYPIESLLESWDTNLNSWINIYLISKVYNSNNNVIERIYKNWENESWVNNSKTINTYTVAYKLAEELILDWNSTNQEWDNDYLQTYNYNEFNNILERTYWTWLGFWSNVSADTFEYDSNQYLIYESYVSEFNAVSYTYYYSEHDINLSVNDNVFQNSISIIPNPTKEILNIESEFSITSIKVYDALGRLVLEESNPSNQLDVSNLSSGLLFVQIETDKGSLTKKIIKE